MKEHVGEEVVRGIISDAEARGYVDFGAQVTALAEFEGEESWKECLLFASLYIT